MSVLTDVEPSAFRLDEIVAGAAVEDTAVVDHGVIPSAAVEDAALHVNDRVIARAAANDLTFDDGIVVIPNPMASGEPSPPRRPPPSGKVYVQTMTGAFAANAVVGAPSNAVDRSRAASLCIRPFPSKG